MTTKEKQELIGAVIRLKDARTGASYTAKIWDLKEVYGKLRICVNAAGNPWFEPTTDELCSVDL